MGTKITEDYFEFGVNKYFRGNAHLVEIGTYGEKKDPIGPKAYLDPQNIVKREHLEGRVSKGTTAEINWNQTTEAAVEVNGRMQVFGLGVSTASGFTYERAKSANLRLFNLFIVEGKLQTMLNKDANGARNYLADEGSDGRIVSEVWVVMEAELSEHFETSASITASANAAVAHQDGLGAGARDCALGVGSEWRHFGDGVGAGGDASHQFRVPCGAGGGDSGLPVCLGADANDTGRAMFYRASHSAGGISDKRELSARAVYVRII